MEVQEKNYVVVVQCDAAVRHVCSGFQCEHAFNARQDAFAGYAADAKVRYISLSCGGCPGRAVERKLNNFLKNYRKREGGRSESVAVHLSTCIVKASHHGPRCPHLDYVRGQVRRAGLDLVEGSRYSQLAGKRRAEGIYPGE